MTTELVEALQRPFESRDIEWRIGRSGVKKDGGVWASALAYLTNRAIMSRLDEVMGPGLWKNEFKEWRVGDKCGVLCGLSLKLESEWVTKWDGAENTDIESVKGGLSDAMKRAAVQWGIGRYLYNLEATFVEVSGEKRNDWNWAQHTNQDKTKISYWWKAPGLPDWALPAKKTDHPPSKPGCVSPEEADIIAGMLSKYGFEETRFLEWATKAAKYKIVAVRYLPKVLFEKAKTILEAEVGVPV